MYMSYYNYPNPVPTREEFHRSYAGEIYQSDYCTSSPSQYMLQNLQKADRFNRDLKKHRRKHQG